MKYIILVPVTFFFANLALADSSCSGWDTQTNAHVTGECFNDSFSGYDSETGAEVFGSCVDGGTFSGWDERTDAFVRGSCS